MPDLFSSGYYETKFPEYAKLLTSDNKDTLQYPATSEVSPCAFVPQKSFTLSSNDGNIFSGDIKFANHDHRFLIIGTALGEVMILDLTTTKIIQKCNVQYSSFYVERRDIPHLFTAQAEGKFRYNSKKPNNKGRIPLEVHTLDTSPVSASNEFYGADNFSCRFPARNFRIGVFKDEATPLLLIGTPGGDILVFDPRIQKSLLPCLLLEKAHVGQVSCLNGGVNLNPNYIFSAGREDGWLKEFDLRFPYHSTAKCRTASPLQATKVDLVSNDYINMRRRQGSNPLLHGRGILSMDMSEDGSLLAVSGFSGEVNIYSLHDVPMRLLKTWALGDFSIFYKVGFTKNSKYALCCGVSPGNRLFSAHLWNIIQPNRSICLKCPGDGAAAYQGHFMLSSNTPISRHVISIDGKKDYDMQAAVAENLYDIDMQHSSHPVKITSPLCWNTEGLKGCAELHQSNQHPRMILFTPESGYLSLLHKAFWSKAEKEDNVGSSIWSDISLVDYSAKREEEKIQYLQSDQFFLLKSDYLTQWESISTSELEPQETEEGYIYKQNYFAAVKQGLSDKQSAHEDIPLKLKNPKEPSEPRRLFTKMSPQLSAFTANLNVWHPSYGRTDLYNEPFFCSHWGNFIVGVGGNSLYKGLQLWDTATGICLATSAFPEAARTNISCVVTHPNFDTGVIATAGSDSSSRGRPRVDIWKCQTLETLVSLSLREEMSLEVNPDE